MSRHANPSLEDEAAGAPEGASGIFFGFPRSSRHYRVLVAVIGGLTALVALYLVLHSGS